jgi:hypothetical protein
MTEDLPPELIQAFTGTDYIVHHEPPFTMIIGKPCEELKEILTKQGLTFLDGIGLHPSNHWPGEASLLVLGLDFEAAKSLARHYGQHAFLWAGDNGVPELTQPWSNTTP